MDVLETTKELNQKKFLKTVGDLEKLNIEVRYSHTKSYHLVEEGEEKRYDEYILTIVPNDITRKIYSVQKDVYDFLNSEDILFEGLFTNNEDGVVITLIIC